MKIKVLIVEDEVLIASEIRECLEENDFEVSNVVTTAEDALNSVTSVKPDVILMDISIKGKINGIDLAKKILETHAIPVIFLTSNTDTVMIKEAKSINPNAFLLKPFNETELPIAIELAFTNHNAQTLRDIGRPPLLNESVFVKSNKRFNKISTSEINFIQAEGSYSRIFTKNGEYIVSYNLSQFQNEIDNRYFMRVHRSYVVNLKNIEGFDLESVFVSGKAIPVSKQYQADLFKAVKKF